MFDILIVCLVIHIVLIFALKSLLKKYVNYQNKWWYLTLIVFSVVIIPVRLWRL